MLGLLFSRGGLMMIAALAVTAVIGVQTARLDHAKGDLTQARAALTTLKASLTASEQARQTEHAQATEAISAAEASCLSRVAEAHRSADRIHTLVERPHATDPKTGCPIRALLRADELRDAINPGT